MFLDVIFAAVLILFVLFGLKRGFVKSLIGALSTILSIVIAWVLYKPVSAFLYQTPLPESIGNIVKNFIGSGGEAAYTDALPAALRNVAESSTAAAAQSAAESATIILVNICSILIVIFAAKLILWVVSLVFGTVTKLPIIHQLDALLGGALGLVIGVIVLSVVCAVFTLFIASPSAAWISQQLQSSSLAKYIYDNNFLLNLLS
ncbi:MAG: CvpA family protein [Clostridia bacterium]|nr:CvpA family protein [Clostridia bacterium]